MKAQNKIFSQPLYPMRLIGSFVCVALGVITLQYTGEWHVWYVVALIVALTYPHIIRIIAGQLERRHKLELRASLIDAFLLGTTVYVMGFSAIPTISLMTIALANGVALGGIYFLMITLLSLAASIAIPTMLYGINFNPQNILLLNIIATAALFIYFIMFALVAYKRAILLQKSRADLRQQKNVVEIEKKKSENLLRALIPESIATTLEKDDTAEPAYHAATTILIADIIDFDRVSDTLTPKQLVDELNYCYKAFDQIVIRHNLEPLRTSGGSYISVAGAPVTSSTHASDTVKAAIEMQRFAIEYYNNRQLTGQADFQFRFVMHTGPLISGLISTRKFTFDVWGATVKIALKIKYKAKANDILLTQDVVDAIEEQLKISSLGLTSIDDENTIHIYTLDDLTDTKIV